MSYSMKRSRVLSWVERHQIDYQRSIHPKGKQTDKSATILDLPTELLFKIFEYLILLNGGWLQTRRWLTTTKPVATVCKDWFTIVCEEMVRRSLKDRSPYKIYEQYAHWRKGVEQAGSLSFTQLRVTENIMWRICRERDAELDRELVSKLSGLLVKDVTEHKHEFTDVMSKTMSTLRDRQIGSTMPMNEEEKQIMKLARKVCDKLSQWTKDEAWEEHENDARQRLLNFMRQQEGRGYLIATRTRPPTVLDDAARTERRTP